MMDSGPRNLDPPFECSRRNLLRRIGRGNSSVVQQDSDAIVLSQDRVRSAILVKVANFESVALHAKRVATTGAVTDVDDSVRGIVDGEIGHSISIEVCAPDLVRYQVGSRPGP